MHKKSTVKSFLVFVSVINQTTLQHSLLFSYLLLALLHSLVAVMSMVCRPRINRRLVSGDKSQLFLGMLNKFTGWLYLMDDNL
jgi:hypothetical protein